MSDIRNVWTLFREFGLNELEANPAWDKTMLMIERRRMAHFMIGMLQRWLDDDKNCGNR